MAPIEDETVPVGDSPVRANKQYSPVRGPFRGKRKRTVQIDVTSPAPIQEPKEEPMPQTRPDTESYMGMDRMPSFESSPKRAKRTPLASLTEWIWKSMNEITRMDPEIIDGVNIKQLGLKASAVDAISNENLDDILKGNYKGVAADAELHLHDFVEGERPNKEERGTVSYTHLTLPTNREV